MKSAFVYRRGALGDTVAMLPFLFALGRMGYAVHFAGAWQYRELFTGIDFITYRDADSADVLREIGNGGAVGRFDRTILFSRSLGDGGSGVERYDALPADRWFYEHPFNATGISFSAAPLYLPLAGAPPSSVAAIGRPYFVIHPGSGGPAKVWPLAHFMKVGAMLESRGYAVVYALGESEAPCAGALANALTCRDCSLNELSFLLSLSTGYIGCDSGVTHLAGVLNVPGWALFGPSSPAVYRPWGAIGVIRSPENSMAALAPEQVIDSIGAGV